MITGWSAERLIVQIGIDGADIAGESIGGAAGEPAPVLRRARTHEAWRASSTGSRGPARTSQASPTGPAHGAGGARHASGSRRPRRWRSPVTRRVAPRSFLDRTLVVAAFPRIVLGVGRAVAGRIGRIGIGSRHRGTGRCRGRRPTRARVRRLATGPLLERRADGERTREAVRLLVRQRAWSGVRLGIAAMAVIRSVRPLVPLVLERHERACRRSIGAGQPTLGHRGDDTRGARPRVVGARGSAARLTCPTQARTLRTIPRGDTVKPHPQCEGVPCLA